MYIPISKPISCHHWTDIFGISARYRKRHWTGIVLPIGIKSDQYLVECTSVQYQTDVSLVNYKPLDLHCFHIGLILDRYYFKLATLFHIGPISDRYYFKQARPHFFFILA